jgi:elongation factor Tu
VAQRPPDIEAEIQFLTTEEGGRQTPVKSGYRPHHDFGVDETQFDAAHEYVDREWVSPGETVVAMLTFPGPACHDYLAGRLHEGFEFTVQEGARVVARGRITKVLNEALLRTEP